MLPQIQTPALLLEERVLLANARHMADRIAGLGASLRPHVKTHKSLEAARLVAAAGNTAGITVSTLAEAEFFFAGGFSDILYAVGMADAKVERAAVLIRAGCGLAMITDDAGMARRLGAAAERAEVDLPLLIELDVDGHRSGVDPDGDALLEVARVIGESERLTLRGVMTHAGGSYAATTAAERAFHARREIERTRAAAARLRAAGFGCPVVSVGSTPTAMSYEELEGVTEVRAGVYAFHDLVQVGIGVARTDDIAISVLTTVIGHQRAKGWTIVDAGWTALSRDRGTADQPLDQGYGVVCDEAGEPIEGAIVIQTNQEHGIVAARPGAAPLDPDGFPVGTRLRILPNHACATAAQFDGYEVLRVDGSVERWARAWAH